MAEHNEKFFENDTGVYFKSLYPSQWYIIPFTIEDITYNCCEQYMMSEKAKFFNDMETNDLIMNAFEPKDQKKLGREVKNFNVLHMIKFGVMVLILPILLILILIIGLVLIDWVRRL